MYSIQSGLVEVVSCLCVCWSVGMRVIACTCLCELACACVCVCLCMCAWFDSTSGTWRGHLLSVGSQAAVPEFWLQPHLASAQVARAR